MQSTTKPSTPSFRAATFAVVAAVSACALTASACARDCSTVHVPFAHVVLVTEDGNQFEAVEADNGGPVVEYRSEGSELWRDCDTANGQWQCGGGGLEPASIAIRATHGALTGMTSNIRIKYGRCHPITRNVEILMQ